MQTATVTFEDVLRLARQLTALEKARLIEKIVPDIKQSLENGGAAAPRETFWGALADLGPAPSFEDIKEIRREMWANFPREDI